MEGHACLAQFLIPERPNKIFVYDSTLITFIMSFIRNQQISMQAPSLLGHQRLAYTDPEILFTQNLVHKRRNRQPNLPFITFDDDEVKLIQGWSTKLDREEFSLNMLHTLSRNIRSYEKMQRKLSEKRNLRQLKEQYKNVRHPNTSRPQTSARLKVLSRTRIHADTSLAYKIQDSQISDVDKDKAQVCMERLCDRKVDSIRAMNQFDEIRQVNQKKLIYQRRTPIHHRERSDSNKMSIKPRCSQNQLSKQTKALNQRLKRILCQKSNTSLISPAVDLTVPLRQGQKLSQTSEFLASARSQRLSKRSKSPAVFKQSNQKEFQDSKLFRYR